MQLVFVEPRSTQVLKLQVLSVISSLQFNSGLPSDPAQLGPGRAADPPSGLHHRPRLRQNSVASHCASRPLAPDIGPLGHEQDGNPESTEKRQQKEAPLRPAEEGPLQLPARFRFVDIGGEYSSWAGGAEAVPHLSEISSRIGVPSAWKSIGKALSCEFSSVVTNSIRNVWIRGFCPTGAVLSANSTSSTNNTQPWKPLRRAERRPLLVSLQRIHSDQRRTPQLSLNVKHLSWASRHPEENRRGAEESPRGPAPFRGDDPCARENKSPWPSGLAAIPRMFRPP